MTYQENYQKWLNYTELPDYLREELTAMDEKQKRMPFILILNLVQLVCAAILVLGLIASIFT